MRSATKAKKGKDPEYLAFLHALPCLVCERLNLAPGGHKDQSSPTEGAHVGARGLSQKCPDHEAIPLCLEHHREDAESAHKLGRKFWEHHGLVKQDVIAALNRAFEESR